MTFNGRWPWFYGLANPITETIADTADLNLTAPGHTFDQPSASLDV